MPSDTFTSSTTNTSTSATSAPATSENYNPSAAVFGKRTLSMGMHGSDVMALQHDLTALGFATAATGNFTQTTLAKLKAFQHRYRLTPDGVAGPTSVSALKRLLRSSLHIMESANAKALTTSATSVPLSAADSGGVGFVPAAPTTAATTPAQNATLIDGLAIPAPGTPQVIVDVIDAANKIAFKPYIYGGGHASFTAAGYDCSGSVSYALHGGGLLATPLDSSQFLSYGDPGAGNWITIWTNGPTHAYMEIAGLWYDTAAQTASNGDDRWSLTRVNEPAAYGTFVPRHPAGW